MRSTFSLSCDLATAAASIAITLAAACSSDYRETRRALLFIDTLQPRTISIIGRKPAPFAMRAAISPAVAITAAAVVSPVPARAGFQYVFSFSEIADVDGSTTVVFRTAAAGWVVGQGHGDLHSGEKKVDELHDNVFYEDMRDDDNRRKEND